jgi:putative membrane protein
MRLALLAFLILALACHQQEQAKTDTTVTSPAGQGSEPPPETVMPGDREFAQTAAKGGMAEVQLATNVASRAAHPEVRAFAQKMIEDHNRANHELTELASRKGLDPPADLDPGKKALDEELAKLTCPALDKKYMQTIVEDHAITVKRFEDASRALHDADLRAWAAKTLPTLHEHHRLAEEIAAKLE